MKFSHSFLLVSFLCTSTAAGAGVVKVFPNFLSSEEVEHYRQEATRKKVGAVAAGLSHRRQTVTLQEHVHDMVRTALLAAGDYEAAAEDRGVWVKKLMLDTPAQVTTLTSTLKSHVDYYYTYQDGGAVFDEGPVKDLVGFVFLTQDEGAYFRQGDDTVLAQTGTLVTYPADMEHVHFIPQGKTLEILGPFAVVDQGLGAVGPGKKTFMRRKWMVQGKNTDKGAGSHEAKSVPVAQAPKTLGLGGAVLVEKTPSRRKLMKSDKGGKDKGGSEATTVAATVAAPAPAVDLSSSTACGCRAVNGAVECVTTGCGTLGSSTAVPPAPDTTGTSDVFGSVPEATVSAPAPTTIPAIINATMAPVTGNSTMAPVVVGATMAPATMAPAAPAQDETNQLEFTPPLAPEPGMVMTWEMQGGTGPCTCTTTSSAGGYCVGECGHY